MTNHSTTSRQTRRLQITFLGLLLICFAQVVWWILDEVTYSRQVVERTREIHHSNLRAAYLELALGGEKERIVAGHPDLRLTGDGSFEIRPELLNELEQNRRSRINRFGWEGSFFLVVLALGMGVLWQALRRDLELRRRQQNFLAAVSHEFKSPIASLRLSAETLALRDPPGEQRRPLVDRMLDDLGRLENMVQNLLETSRIEEGGVTLRPERIGLHRLVESIGTALDARLRSLDVTLVNEVPESLEIRVDPAALDSVLRNLLDNAIKSAASGKPGRVTVRGAVDAERITLEVEDDGVGIAAGEAARIFEKFYRPGDEMRRRSQGTGLGLYLVKRLVEASGGEVRALSEGPDQGALFLVSWPLEHSVDSQNERETRR